MAGFRISPWLAALFVSLTLLAAPLSAAITPVGNVLPATIGQVPSQEVLVGHSEVGGLTVDAGSVLTTESGGIGWSEFGIGAVTITGSGSEWTNTGQLDVGRVGMGFLDVKAGGKLSSARTYIGYWDTSTGTVTVSGVGSEFVGDWLRVGNRGSGSLLIEAGGSVANDGDGILGFYAGSIGMAAVSGEGSKWTSSGLRVGNYGAGNLAISAGGQVEAVAGYIGYLLDSTGEVTVSGAGSQWTNLNALEVGFTGHGKLTIEEGAQVTSANGQLAYEIGSTGRVIVTGAGSRWLNHGSLNVGLFGSATLTVEEGGEVETDELYAAFSNLQGNGTITANQGAVLDTMLVFDASHGTSQSYSFGSGGTLNVNWNGGRLGVGYHQSGTLSISDGMTITSSRGVLGVLSGAVGSATVSGSGSRWDNAGELWVGSSGDGTLIIEQGGEVTSASGILGDNSDSMGSLTVTGAGSKWTNSGALAVGKRGSGVLNIRDGGQVSCSRAVVGDGWPEATGEAAVTVSGENSLWRVGSSLRVAGFSDGHLIIREGGVVESVDGLVGNSAVGSVSVEASSHWLNHNSLYVGVFDGGSLRVNGGGRVTNTDGYIGYDLAADGRVTVVGTNSTWTNNDELTVGLDGSATLDIIASGLVTVRNILTIDSNLDNDSFINIATGGMLALSGDADDSLTQFLDLVSGTDAIRYWDASLADWSPLTAATYGDDYTLEYLTTGDLAGYTLLTVGRVGDFDNDGDVDGRDLLAWQRNPQLGSLADWQNAYGSVAPATEVASPVPEPRCLVLLLGLMLLSGRVSLARG